MNDFNVTCFLLLARTQDYSRVAQELSISKQAVARNIFKLEEELGYPLFYRNYYSILLTEAGNRFFRHFKTYELELADAKQTVANADKMSSLRIGWCEWTGCPKWLSDAIDQFSIEYSEIDVSIRSESPVNVARILIEHEVDIIFSSRYLTKRISNPIVSLPLCELPLNLVISKYHPLFETVRTDHINTDHILKTYAYHTCYASEDTKEEVICRAYDEYASLDSSPNMVLVLPNQDSVYVDIYLRNGITFAPANNRLAEINYFMLLPLPRTVTLMLSRLCRNKNPYAEKLEEYLKKYPGETK